MEEGVVVADVEGSFGGFAGLAEENFTQVVGQILLPKLDLGVVELIEGSFSEIIH